MLIESLSGVRGYDTDLTVELISSYAAALKELLACRKVVIGRDTRASGVRIREQLTEALQRYGITVTDLGICPTPTVEIAVVQHRVDAGVVITASHNPLPWNGLKFLGADGLFLNPDQMVWIKQNRQSILAKYSEHHFSPGALTIYERANRDHIDTILQLPYIEIEAIRRQHFKVAVDAVNGAGSLIIPELLKELGCEVIAIHCDPNQPFPHPPEPLPENLTDLCRVVKDSAADIGLAIDPDGDRLAIVSDKGLPISEEYTLVLATKLVLSKTNKKNLKVVANLSTTRALDDLATQYGAEVIRTPVGEINVARRMQIENALIGGEGNGGVILPEAHLGRDSLVGTALVLQLLAEERCSLSAVMPTLPQYLMVKRKAPRGKADFNEIMNHLIKSVDNAEINTEDGLKFSWRDSWVHIRTSNTEPIVRIYSEAPTSQTANQLADRFVALLQKFI
ncbi:MAG TPA: phosphoglucosamine mutase [Candidatus Marinimicrobia bacterium]|nr:phosphoglucosamine mutase [Candidatus Neomarinimicrobiota bacterium]